MSQSEYVAVSSLELQPGFMHVVPLPEHQQQLKADPQQYIDQAAAQSSQVADNDAH